MKNKTDDNIQWSHDTKQKIQGWLSDRGFAVGRYTGLESDKCDWKVNVECGSTGGWANKRDYSVVEIRVSAYPRSFTKKIMRKSDKTDAVLSKIDELLKVAIQETADSNARHKESQTIKAFQKSVVNEHFPGLELRHKTEGSDLETFRISLSLERSTLEKAKAVMNY